MYNELRHTGVKGMKWGIRRYQNPDGTLTEEGKRRKRHKEERSRQKSDYRNRGGLTATELQDNIKRLQLEKQFRELTESEVSPGRKYAEDVLKEVGKRALPAIGTGALLYGAAALTSRSFNPKDLAAALFNGGPKKK